MFKYTVLFLALLPFVSGGSLMEELEALDSTTFIRDLLNTTGLDKVIDAGYFTIFAPSDEAFGTNVDDRVAIILAISGVIQYHSTRGIFRSQDAFNNLLIDSGLDGSKIRVNVYNDAQNALFITLNGAKVLKANIQATNGYLHLIDRVMFPPAGSFYDLIEASENHKILKQAIDQDNLQDFFRTTVGTLFAPTDAAFMAVSKAIEDISQGNQQARKEFLLYHMLDQVVFSAGAQPGDYATKDKGEKLTGSMGANGTVMINQAKVIYADLAATNGVVHIIDSVLIPEPWASAIILG